MPRPISAREAPSPLTGATRTAAPSLVGDGYARSVYHSLQITFDKRFSRGLQFQTNYTWSSFIDD
ncbi:MAG: hypothetical protein NZM33_01195 [Bryobacteraceae bacterium]|nr:hypothetical protein [Bryobacteraceae bacterium]